MVRGNRRHTKVKVLPVDGDLDSSVLRNALFGDFHLRHDLYARDDGLLETLRRRVHFSQGSVDTVADTKFLLHRLDMNIGGLHLDGGRDKHRRELDYRSVITSRVVAREPHLIARLDIGGSLVGVKLSHSRLNLRAWRNNSLDIAPVKNVPERINRVVPHRVGKRDRNGILVGDDGNDAVPLGDVAGKLLYDFGTDRIGVDVTVLKPELVGESP